MTAKKSAPAPAPKATASAKASKTEELKKAAKPAAPAREAHCEAGRQGSAEGRSGQGQAGPQAQG